MGQKLGPAFDAGSLRGVERLPLGTDRPAAQPQAGLVGSPVPFAGVAPLAGGHAVGPARRSPLRPGQDVVDGDRLGPRLRAAVLASVMIALGQESGTDRKAGRVRYWQYGQESGTDRKAGRVRYWQYGLAGNSPNLAKSDPSRFPLPQECSLIELHVVGCDLEGSHPLRLHVPQEIHEIPDDKTFRMQE